MLEVFRSAFEEHAHALKRWLFWLIPCLLVLVIFTEWLSQSRAIETLGWLSIESDWALSDAWGYRWLQILLAPALPGWLSLYGAWIGSRLLKGKPGGPSLELLLAAPLTRRRLILEKAGSIAAILFVICLGFFGLTALLALVSKTGVSFLQLAANNLVIWLEALSFSAIALFLSIVTWRPRMAAALSSSLVVAAAAVLLPVRAGSALLPALRALSPLGCAACCAPTASWPAGMLSCAAWLAGAAGVFFLLAVVIFERRDLNQE